jgi:hypothetical protein
LLRDEIEKKSIKKDSKEKKMSTRFEKK